MAAGFSLKDQLFNPAKVARLGREIHAAWPAFDAALFERRVCARLPELELKARIAWIAAVLDEMLPPRFDHAAEVIEAALPDPLDPALTDKDFGEFIYAPYGEVAVLRGLEEHRDRLLDLLEAITQRFSMEYAIRPVLNRWPDAGFARMQAWAGHGNYHVRRLASEGARPRLPWGIGLRGDPLRGLPILDALHGDPTRYVTRSVANHLNDVARIDPEAALARVAAWRRAERQSPDELAWMTSHALRGLVKAGHPGALGVLGFDPAAEVACRIDMLTPEAAIGGTLAFDVTLEAGTELPVLVDWLMESPAGGGRRGPKVFKLKKTVVAPGQPVAAQVRYRLKGDATTFRLRPGPHGVAVQVNGRVLARAPFALG
jgi:3-methyladenine DNA glycosylase AlkC